MGEVEILFIRIITISNKAKLWLPCMFADKMKPAEAHEWKWILCAWARVNKSWEWQTWDFFSDLLGSVLIQADSFFQISTFPMFFFFRIFFYS